MKVSKDLCKVVADLGNLIGSECYNPNSYDGWNNVEGCSFRYPVNVPNKEGNFSKFKGNIKNSQIYASNDEQEIYDSLMYMKYKFGSNELFIGKGIFKVLGYLEERYDIKFSELEEKIND